jgi:hypothetical protein
MVSVKLGEIDPSVIQTMQMRVKVVERLLTVEMDGIKTNQLLVGDQTGVGVLQTELAVESEWILLENVKVNLHKGFVFLTSQSIKPSTSSNEHINYDLNISNVEYE